MVWFHRHASGRPTTVGVLGCADHKAVGSGVLLPGGHVLTCAHVVNCALGQDKWATERPEPATVSVQVRVHVPDGPLERTARLRVWIPPGPSARNGSLEWDGDLAVLDLGDDMPPHVRPARWHAMTEGQSVRAWHGGGHAASLARARVTSCNGRIGYVDGESTTGAAIEHGYSGGPLWWGEQEAVVGLVAAAVVPPGHPATPYSPNQVARRSWGIPYQRVREELARAGWEGTLDEVHGAGTASLTDPAHRAFAEILDWALSDPVLRARVARTVAEQCGYDYPRDGSVPSVDEFVWLLATDPRALPALTAVLRPSDPEAADELLAAGRLYGKACLLSPDEHGKLLAILKELPDAAGACIPSAVRAALPHAELDSELLTGAGWAGSAEARAPHVQKLVDHLEGLRGDSRPVPAGTSRAPGLLRVIEYLAAACAPDHPDHGERLTGWSSAVAARLGVHEALEERRVDARKWAARWHTPVHAPRVLVRLVVVPPGQGSGERYRIRIWCDEGWGPRRVSDDDERPRGAAEVAEEILGVLDPLHLSHPAGKCSVVEFLVDRDGLELPADQWEWRGPAGLLTGVMGAEYPVVVNCPELLRQSGEQYKAHWQERWQRLDDGGTVHIDRSTGSRLQVYGLLLNRHDAVQVTVGDLPSPLRVEIVQVCLAMGFPVVLWDRGDAPGSHVAGVVAGVPTRRLPEKVRAYRADVLRQPQLFPGRPVLAWADADRPAPTLELADPTEDIK